MKLENNQYSRRDVLRFTLAGAGAAALGPLLDTAHAAADSRRFVVMVNLDGGNDSLNTVVPLNSGSYHDRRPSLGIDSPLELNTGPTATADYGLHPNLSGLQTLHNEGSLAVIHKVGYPNANRSHFTSKDIFHTGDSAASNANNKSGWVARYAQLYNNHPLGCISIGYNSKALQGDAVNLMQMRQLSSFGMNDDNRFRGESMRRAEVARSLLARFDNANGNTQKVRNAMQVGHDNLSLIQQALESYNANVTYPANSKFSQSMESIAQLIHAGGLGTDIYYTGLGGFDTHSRQGSTGGKHPNLMNELNRSLDAFATDMKMLGKWDDCVIVVFSEFGRRNSENGTGGTDHGEGQTLLVTGGAVNGGVRGAHLSDSDIRDHSNLPVETDFRAVFGEVISSHLGKDPAAIFTDPNQLANGPLGIL